MTMISSSAIIPFEDKTPALGKDVFVAAGAKIIGDVSLGDRCNIWFNAVLRGDVGPIRIGNDVNVQDNCVIHVTTGGPHTTIGHRVTIGHSAIIHACTIEDECLIGMGAVILDGAVIKKGAFIAAFSLVAPHKIIEGEHLWQGSPARKIRPTSTQDKKLIRETARNYHLLAQKYRSPS